MSYIYRTGVRNSLHYVAPTGLGELLRRLVWAVLRGTLGRLAK